MVLLLLTSLTGTINAVPYDTVTKIETKVALAAAYFHQLILKETTTIDSLKELKNSSSIGPKTIKLIQNKLNTSIRQREQLYQVENSYNYILSLIRQLKYQKEIIADMQLKEILQAMNQLEKNNIPSFKKIKKISTSPYFKDESAVYDKNLNSFCNLTMNMEKSMLANVFEIFYEYTDPKIGNHFKENDFLKCQARFIKTKKEYFLELQFIFLSPKASQIYGSIDPSSPSRLDFINGKHIYLQSFAMTSAIVEPGTGNTIYNIQYKLDREDLAYIKKYDVDAFTIIWSSGADRFEIYKIDVLKNMIECLQKKKLQN